ncbi:hypothetical protein K1719_022826 [Acacia pycnantha]|nr:hypothetical protein K1719_022819 [Acacia pycnantha]KAI9105110.1 hypothetical protein K1719_022826 [Acacia pycnantha]
MQSKDKFLLQSTIVGTITDVDELPPDTFNKDSGKTIEESKLRVVYVTNTSTSEDEAMKGTAPKFDNNSMSLMLSHPLLSRSFCTLLKLDDLMS